MGLRGPAPTPTPILNMRGSRWPDRNRHGEPQPPIGTPRCPKNLNRSERAIWKTVCASLRSMNVLTVVDGAQLERYAVMYIRWRKCLDFIAAKDEEHGRQGLVVPPGCYPKWAKNPAEFILLGKDGLALVGFKHYPAVKEAYLLDSAMKQIEREFGLTPSARARLKTPTTESTDEFEDFMNGKQERA